MSTVTVGAAGAAGTFDHTCDGTADEVEIVAAIADCGAGDTASLSAGQFECAAGFDIPAGISLVGTAGTILNFATGAALLVHAKGANAAADLDLRGPVTFSIEGSAVACARLVSRQAVHGRAAFRVLSTGGTVEAVAFDDCHAIDTSGFGWLIEGSGAAPRFKDLTIANCTATNCGAAHDLDYFGIEEWITGICLASGDAALTLENVQAVDCAASGSYESGFHCEKAVQVIGCGMTRCTSTGNGVKPSAVYGAGFVCPPSWTLTDCTATDNRIGFNIGNHATNPHSGETVTLTRCTVNGGSEYAAFVFNGVAAGALDHVVMSQCATVGVDYPKSLFVLAYVTGLRAHDLRLIGGAGQTYEAAGCSDNVVTYYLSPFRAAIAAPVTGEAVAFTETSENDGLTAWTWDFGDGSGSAAQHPTHAYPSAGVYPVTLTAGGNVVSQTVTVLPGVTYGGARLSEADLGPLDHDPVANATDLHSGRVGLQGSPVSRKAWTIDALADDHAEIEALAALKGQHLVLNLNGVEYPGTMICKPFIETQLTPAAWAYQVGFVQETRR